MSEPLFYLSRVIHILGAVSLIGGLLYAWNLSRAGMLPATPSSGFVPAVWVLVAAQFLSGGYNLMVRLSGAEVPSEYHMLFGLKFLLFLHIAAVSILMVKPATTPEKRARMLTGLAISGIAVILISSWLRYL